ncbi:MAG: hypothetical protein OES47_04305 [Acidobacteriota bacterium]|nr:hypothetical protein [Acidobacteriota bacterium]
MATFQEKKLAAFEAAERARKRARLAAMIGVALLTAVPVTGVLWFAVPAILALLACVFWYLVFQNLKSRGSTSAPVVEGMNPPERPAAAALGSEPPTHAPPEPAGQAIEDWVSLQLRLPESLTFKTENGEEVVLAAGPRDILFRLSFASEREDQDSDAIDYPVCDLRLCDDQDTWWQVSTYFEPYDLTAPLERGTGPIHFWQDVPQAWKEALETSCLISGVESLLDSRERIELSVGDRSVTMMFKYQGPEIDVGWLDSEGKLVVRVAKMHYELWKDREFDDIVDGVTFGYLLDPEGILLPTSPEAHWSEWNVWEEDLGEDRPLPVLSKVIPT